MKFNIIICEDVKSTLIKITSVALEYFENSEFEFDCHQIQSDFSKVLEYAKASDQCRNIYLLDISLPHYISVGAFVLTASVLCKLVLNENKITSLASAMIIAFFHRVMMLIYFSAMYIFARECFTYGLRCFYSMLYAMVFLNITAFAAMWFYEKYRNIKYISEKAVSIIKSLDFLVLNPKRCCRNHSGRPYDKQKC